MDPFDEFEFKPLTEGLGFHKKQKSLKDSVKESELELGAKPSLPTSAPMELEAAMSSANKPTDVPPKKLTFEDIVTSLESAPLEVPSAPERETYTGSSREEKVEFSSPLPRNKKPEFQLMDVEIEPVVRSPFPTPQTYNRPSEVKKTPHKDQLASVGTRRGAADSPRTRLKVSPGSLSAAILDLIVVVALGLIFTTALLTVTGVQLQTLISSTNTDLMTQISVGILLVSVMQIYFIISRAFCGKTLGEWTFDLQLGRDEDFKSENYPLRVILRSLVVTFTGVIVIPVLSFVFRRDLAGKITGLNLYSQNY